MVRPLLTTQRPCCSFEAQLEGIFSDLHQYNRAIESRIKAAGFKARVMQVFQAWTEWAVYPKDFLALLKHLFLDGQLTTSAEKSTIADTDIDGAPLSGDEKDDEDLDGVPLDGAALLKSALARRDFAQGPVVHSPSGTGGGARAKGASRDIVDDDDIDGVPLGTGEDFDDDIDGVPLEDTAKSGGGFIPSKWETIAPDQVEAQAITSSKWDTLETEKGSRRKRSYDSSDEYQEEDEEEVDNNNSDDSSQAKGLLQRSSYDEEKRAKLREIELQTIQYQDELESGARSLRDGMTMSGQLEQFRQKLMKRSLSDLRSPSDNDRYSGNISDRRRSASPDE